MRVPVSAAGTPRDVHIARHRGSRTASVRRQVVQCDRSQTGGSLHRCIICRQQLVRLLDICVGASAAAGNMLQHWHTLLMLIVTQPGCKYCDK